MGDLLQFGNYAGYIWAAYGMSAVALGGLAYFTWYAYGAAKRKARKLEAGE